MENQELPEVGRVVISVGGVYATAILYSTIVATVYVVELVGLEDGFAQVHAKDDYDALEKLSGALIRSVKALSLQTA